MAPLVHVALDAPGTEDEDVASAAASTLAVAMSNNAEVQALVHAWRPPAQTSGPVPPQDASPGRGHLRRVRRRGARALGRGRRAVDRQTRPAPLRRRPPGHYGDETVDDPGYRNDVEHRDVAKTAEDGAANGERRRYTRLHPPGDWPEPRLGVEARLARLALDESVNVERRVRCMFALGAMLGRRR